MAWSVYILTCADGTLYTGVTTDIKRRLKEHNAATGPGAKYTRARQPVALFYTEEWPDRSQAQIREAAIKKLTRVEKEALAKGRRTRQKAK